MKLKLPLCFTLQTACFLLLAVALRASASHVEETITLSEGWNAIYLEATPEESACSEFFSGMPVTKVQSYQSDAYDDTAQYDSEGKEKVQKPISFYQWISDAEDISTLKSLTGGSVYLVYATNACTRTFYGVPKVPFQRWRAASASEGLLNFAGVSIATDSKPSAAEYFGEGPYGESGLVYSIGGTGDAPTMRPMSIFGRSPKLSAGTAYALSAASAGDWGGVIRVSGLGSFDFDTGYTKSSITVINAGTTNHIFRFTLRDSEKASDKQLAISRYIKENALDSGSWSNLTAGASWEVELEPNENLDITLGLDRSGITDADAEYGSLLEITDLGKSAMRVRIPITAEASSDSAAGNTGLWIGGVALSSVSSLTNGALLAAEGVMKATMLLHVDEHEEYARLLQRVTVAYGTDTNDTASAALYASIDDVPDTATSKRRISSILLSTTTAQVVGKGAFGDKLEFDYTIDAYAADNPFRHAWHPDHDGVNAEYDGKTLSGDDIGNYVDTVLKPEIWSITNHVTLAWKSDDGKPIYASDPDGYSAGVIVWEMGGLANTNITCAGVFSLQRAFTNGKIEGLK